MVLDTKDIDTVNKIEELGFKQYKDFVKEHLVDRSKQLDDVIKKNLLCLFSTPTKRQKTKAQAID